MDTKFLTLPIQKTVFPDSVGIVTFFADKDVDAVRRAADSSEVVILIPRSGHDTGVSIGDVGALCEIEQFLVGPYGLEGKLAYKAEKLVKITSIVLDASGVYYCGYTPVVYYTENPAEAESLYYIAKEVFEEYAGNSEMVPSYFSFENVNEEMIPIIARLPRSDKYKFLKLTKTEDRLIFFIASLKDAMAVREIDDNVQQKVKEAMDLNQREYYVREQIRALSSEIEDEDETEEYIQKINNLKVSDAIKDKLKKEAAKIRRMAPASPDLALIKNYLDTALELPWGVYTQDNDNLEDAEKILNEDHYGLQKVKERLLEALAVRKLCKDGRSPIICLVGPPGTGKTSIAKSIARAMNKNYVRLSFGGVRDEAEIRGHRKTYVGAMPGRIINGIKTAGSMNPVFLMDEIDKMASDYKGDPASALLEVLDPEQNINFRDHFLEVPFDLSKVLFITTANTLDTISRPLLDRMEIIELSGYTDIEKSEIAKRYLIKKAQTETGVKPEWVNITDDAISAVINLYTRESGVRGLEKAINKIMRKVARKFVESSERDTEIINSENLNDYMGEPIYIEAAGRTEDEIGVVTGLAWTPVGGDTLSIEVSVTKGKGEIVLTGSLGDVMKESAKIAISYCHAIQDELKLPNNFFKEHDIHIHVPEGATPKDGPSAGITILTALVSALSKRRVNHSVAMTGELTLRGRVLPIGGLKEKSLAAMRAGVKKIFLPEDNKKDYKELPDIVKNKIEFIFVNNVQTVILGALL